MTRGRKPKPTQLKVLEGNPGKRRLNPQSGACASHGERLRPDELGPAHLQPAHVQG